jgi:hypothetical protein
LLAVQQSCNEATLVAVFPANGAKLIACEPNWPLAGIPNTNVMFENATWIPPVTQTVSTDV